jgi:hypothetical protein
MMSGVIDGHGAPTDSPTGSPADAVGGGVGGSVGDGVGDGAGDGVPARPSRRRRIDKGLLAVSVAIAVGLVLMGRGLLAGVTGDERANLPDRIEAVEPVPEAIQVLAQTNVFVDLTSGYTGVLVIDGIEIPTVDVGEIAGQAGFEPGQQIDLPPVTIYEPGNATLTFTPSDDALISEFTPGQHQAQVLYWRPEDGRGKARSYTWAFTVV